ncbi:MAG: hypothetical protein RJA70_3509 [Pseudomonadota bacterium]
MIAGGSSSEASVSWKSAEGVAAALSEGGWGAQILELDADLPGRLVGVDVAFPIAHGALGEDGCLQGLLEILGVPYVGSDVRASAIAAHKPSAKAFFRAAGLPVAEERVVGREHKVGSSQLDLLVREVLSTLGTNVVLKPASGGSAIGVHLLRGASARDIHAALGLVLPFDDALIEPLLEGDELTCAVLEEPEPTALPPTRILPQAAGWYDFESKYKAGGSLHECPAQLPEASYEWVRTLAVAAHLAVGARDLSRVDFVLSAAGPVLLEVNTLPGMTATSLFPEAAAAAGIGFSSLCDRLVRRALARPKRAGFPALPMPD